MSILQGTVDCVTRNDRQQKESRTLLPFKLEDAHLYITKTKKNVRQKDNSCIAKDAENKTILLSKGPHNYNVTPDKNNVTLSIENDEQFTKLPQCIAGTVFSYKSLVGITLPL